jgi:hypothetical protein
MLLPRLGSFAGGLPMLTILDFQITRAAPENFHMDVCERGQSQPLASASIEYRLDFMAGFELERLDYDRRNPRGRLELLRAYGARLYEKLFASPDVRRVWQEYRERFADFIPKEMNLPTKWFFAAPPILWMMALYLCLKVLKTEGMEVRLKAPNEIRDRLQNLVRDKQHDLDIAFWLLLAGLVAAVLLLIWRRLI